jgi:hypothetical protein
MKIKALQVYSWKPSSFTHPLRTLLHPEPGLPDQEIALSWPYCQLLSVMTGNLKDDFTNNPNKYSMKACRI